MSHGYPNTLLAIQKAEF